MHNPNPHCSACRDMHDGFFGSWASPCTVHNEDGSLKVPASSGRIIRIQSCKDCPNWDHKGGFGNPAYIPRCNKVRPSRDLPYTTGVSGRMVIARQTHGIPDWCPLETA